MRTWDLALGLLLFGLCLRLQVLAARLRRLQHVTRAWRVQCELCRGDHLEDHCPLFHVEQSGTGAAA